MTSTSQPLRPRPVYRVWIDETGDRGTGPAASPFFGFAAVVIRADRMDTVRAAKQEVNRRAARDEGTELHWSKNLKSHDKRYAACEEIAKLNLRIVYAVLEKTSLTEGLQDRDRMYNWPLRLVLERVSWLVDGAGGLATVTLAAVSGLPRHVPVDYITYKLRSDDECSVEWSALHPIIEVRQAHTRDGLQMADVAAGALDRAMRPSPNPPHRIEPAYLDLLKHRIYTGGPGKVSSYGLKSMPKDLWERFPWFASVNALPRNV